VFVYRRLSTALTPSGLRSDASDLLWVHRSSKVRPGLSRGLVRECYGIVVIRHFCRVVSASIRAVSRSVVLATDRPLSRLSPEVLKFILIIIVADTTINQTIHPILYTIISFVYYLLFIIIIVIICVCFCD
jgi:hypothetical protein